MFAIFFIILSHFVSLNGKVNDGPHQRTLYVRTSNDTKGGGKMILLVSVLEILWGLRIDLMPDGKIYLKALSHSSLVEPLIKNSRSSTERCGQTF